jgi:hypothetical protein
MSRFTPPRCRWGRTRGVAGRRTARPGTRSPGSGVRQWRGVHRLIGSLLTVTVAGGVALAAIDLAARIGGTWLSSTRAAVVTGGIADDHVHLLRTLRRCGLPEAGRDPFLDEALSAASPAPAQVARIRWAMLDLSERQFRHYRRTLGFWSLVGRCVMHRDQRADLRPCILPMRPARLRL